MLPAAILLSILLVRFVKHFDWRKEGSSTLTKVLVFTSRITIVLLPTVVGFMISDMVGVYAIIVSCLVSIRVLSTDHGDIYLE